jgi:hypothetical protein
LNYRNSGEEHVGTAQVSVSAACGGALLSGVVVPVLTRHWQIHQKELEVKIDFVSDISETIMNFLIAIQVAHVGKDRYGQNPDQGGLTSTYRDWQVRSSVWTVGKAVATAQ